ncbi:Protein of unknown function [Chitinophaga sp. CF118]|uniref:ribosomal maturation YjgA family protein n=1 Tax=Chitinophaga sp. CF118 TaxID=1884367 RepID=UPI0008E9AD0A|nr:DUF2809 domain-containing protein [Chitinophaga sp. CF118]SFE08325.1 Protein of unknown function [Chitinophaga sp. CF118]
MLKFNSTYFISAVLLFTIEIIIALYVHDAIIRPYGGDFLVVILIYCLAKSFVNTTVTTAVIVVLLFSYLTEALQYFHIVNILGLRHSKIACIIIGTNFAWTDILMYTLGILLVWLIEIKVLNKPQ